MDYKLGRPNPPKVGMGGERSSEDNMPVVMNPLKGAGESPFVSDRVVGP